jgi:hypothetical protein
MAAHNCSGAEGAPSHFTQDSLGEERHANTTNDDSLTAMAIFCLPPWHRGAGEGTALQPATLRLMAHVQMPAAPPAEPSQAPLALPMEPSRAPSVGLTTHVLVALAPPAEPSQATPEEPMAHEEHHWCRQWSPCGHQWRSRLRTCEGWW